MDRFENIVVAIAILLLAGCTVLIQSTMTDGDEALINIKGNSETTDGTEQ